LLKKKNWAKKIVKSQIPGLKGKAICKIFWFDSLGEGFHDSITWWFPKMKELRDILKVKGSTECFYYKNHGKRARG